MSLRIEKIADMVNQGVIAADIGTDHAFLPILLVSQGKVRKAYACDITEGPLKAAQRNIAKQGLSDRIFTILCDGFDGVPMDTECAVIAGMGYFTCTGILERAMDRLDRLSQIIVEVNRNVREMRQWISDRHFTIEDEVCIHDRNFDYIAISFTAVFHEAYSPEEILCGPVLMKKQEEEYQNYCRKQIKRLDLVLSASKDALKKQEAEEEKAMWTQALQCGA